MGLNWGRDRERQLASLARQQARDTEWTPPPPRRQIPKAWFRAKADQAMKTYDGMITKEITCACGHSGRVRYSATRKPRFRCTRCDAVI